MTDTIIIEDNSPQITIDGEVITAIVGIQGPPGAAGQGLPTGGLTGEILKKKTDTNFDYEWAQGGGSTIYTQDSQPGTTVEGDGWFNTLTGTFMIYASGSWQPQTLDGQNF